jgi:hypothetical protein
MAKKQRSPKVTRKINRQVGKSNRNVDRPLDALPPGQRISKNGKKYYETRMNRSDLYGNI